MKKNCAIFLFAMTCFAAISNAQVKIGENPTSISPGSVLELESTSKALTLPRMTTVQMQAVPSPINGMLIFNTDSNCLYLYKSNNVWASINTEEVHWPYNSNQPVNGAGLLGNAQGIVSLTGTGLVASGNYSHAEGLNSVASGIYSWSIGNTDTAAGNASFSFGTQNKSAGFNSLAFGYKNIATGESAIALGQENYDSGWASMTVGHLNRISNLTSYSNAIGYGNKINAGWSNTTLGESNIIKSGRANTTIGIGNTAEGNYNSLLGYNNATLTGSTNMVAGEQNKVMSGNSNVVLGFNNTGAGNYNHVSGTGSGIMIGNSNLINGDNNWVNSGTANALFGINNIAAANYSAAIGKGNTVFLQSAVALGQGNKDSGWASIAGGLNNIIENNIFYSSVFGLGNTSTRNNDLQLVTGGAATFSAGVTNTNSGYGSLALGGSNRSSNLFSIAANHSTLSNGYAMSAFGHFNDTIAAYPGQTYDPNEILFLIGNGNTNNNRRNSFTMLRNGFTTINALGTPGPNIPRAELDIKGTGALIVPVGTTAERPAVPVEGMIRLCSDCGPGGTAVLQGYDGTAWVNL